MDTYIQLLNDFAPEVAHIDVEISADAFIIGIDVVHLTLQWPVKEQLPEIESDIRALWSGIQSTEQSAEDPSGR